MSEPVHAYSTVADAQLDALEARDPALYNDVLTVCESIFAHTSWARSLSTAVSTEHGVVLRVAVPGRYPYKVFWTPADPRIEAVFPHP